MSEETNNKKSVNEKIAIILIRGRIGMRHDMRMTADLLKLIKKNTCVVLENTLPNKGMVEKIKDYATYGLLDDSTHKLLISKRAQKDKEGKVLNIFKLHPPRGGFERKGTKQPFSNGGALGNRKDKINLLIQRMI